MRALNAERSIYPNSKSHRLTHSTFPILKLHRVESPEQKAGPEQQKRTLLFCARDRENIQKTRLCQKYKLFANVTFDDQ